MRHIIQYDVLISCPSDVERKKYVKAIKEVLETFNNLYEKNYNVHLKSVYWREDGYPEHGDTPQNIINKQIVSSSDINIAVFCSRWGQSTDNYGSATEEEIRKMIAQEKHIFLYFIKCKDYPEDIDRDQWDQIQSFKKEYAKEGIYSEVNDNLKTYKEKLLQNLHNYFEDNKAEIKLALNRDWDHIIKNYEIEFSYKDKNRSTIICTKIFEIEALVNDFQFLTDRYGWKSSSSVISVQGGKIIDIDDENNPFYAYTVKFNRPLNKGDTLKVKVCIELDNTNHRDPCYLSYSPNVPVNTLTLSTLFFDVNDVENTAFEIFEGTSGRSPVEHATLNFINNRIQHTFINPIHERRYTLKWRFKD